MFIQKTLQAIGIFAVVVMAILIFNSVLVAGEKKNCEDWQYHPELWVGWRMEQCESLGFTLQTTP